MPKMKTHRGAAKDSVKQVPVKSKETMLLQAIF